MKHPWFKPRTYKHFDVPVGIGYADKNASDPEFVKAHSWLPLIHYIKREKRYKPADGKPGKTVFKDRDIMYVSHRDACILSKYARDLSYRLDEFYIRNNLSRHILAYRKLGKANYVFSATVSRFCARNMPCIVLCYDISGFFDHLDHLIIKNRLKQILETKEIPEDWYKVYHNVTRYQWIERSDLQAHPTFGPRMKLRTRAPIGVISEVIDAGIKIHPNPSKYGIPQGTPISSALSNLYMIDLDMKMSAVCLARNALYQSYSDDIVLVCKAEDETNIVAELFSAVEKHKLEIKEAKTERVEFNINNEKAFQYLGFNVTPQAASIRPNSLGRQWRKAKRSIRKTQRAGQAAISSGTSSIIYTKKLRKKLSPVGVRNFSSYARNSAREFSSKKILRQILRLERMVDKAIRALKT